MRYFCYNTYKTNPAVDSYIEVLSENDIRKEYYPHWYEQMCKKFGKEHVDEYYCFEACLEDWMIINYGWESIDD